MLRKSFRRGLGLGLLLGAAIALYRTWEARREVAAPAPQPWTPVAPPPPEPAPKPEPAPVGNAVAPEPTPQPEPPQHSAAPSLLEPLTSNRPEPVPEPEPEPEQPVDEVGEPVPEVPAATMANDDIAPVKKQSPRRAARAAKKAAPKKAAPAQPWVDPEGRVCPPSHPVKGKLASKIFHVPGGFNYERTVPDRCYRDSGAAEADGLRQSKR